MRPPAPHSLSVFAVSENMCALQHLFSNGYLPHQGTRAPSSSFWARLSGSGCTKFGSLLAPRRLGEQKFGSHGTLQQPVDGHLGTQVLIVGDPNPTTAQVTGPTSKNRGRRTRR